LRLMNDGCALQIPWSGQTDSKHNVYEDMIQTKKSLRMEALSELAGTCG
jgi:hypothetical protein